MRNKIFDEDLYKKIGKNDLIIFSIYSLKEKGEKCSFDKLVKECFTLFPKIFCFDKFPQWPDSRKLDRPLRDIREKKIISGDPQTNFSLTKNGEKIAKAISENFRQIKLKI